MPEKKEVYKCDACGTIVAVLQEGEGELVCCGEKMRAVTPDKAKTFTFEMAEPGSP